MTSYLLPSPPLLSISITNVQVHFVIIHPCDIEHPSLIIPPHLGTQPYVVHAQHLPLPLRTKLFATFRPFATAQLPRETLKVQLAPNTSCDRRAMLEDKGKLGCRNFVTLP
jgi:hypothetical protein